MLVLASAMASLMAVEAQASVIEYKLDQTNITSLMPNGITYATVRIEDGLNFGSNAGGADIKFTVDIVNSAFTTQLANFGIQEFGFNLATGATAITASNITTAANWTASVPNNGATLDGFGKFKVATGTTGTGRVDPLVFWITGVSGDVASSYVNVSSGNAGSVLLPNTTNPFFAAHITDFGTSNPATTSGWFAGSTSIPPGTGGDVTTVPLPAGAWLFMTGLMGLLYNGKKKSLVAGLAS